MPTPTELHERPRSSATPRFHQAVSALVGDHTIQMRLTYAAAYLHWLHARDLPEDMRDDFEGLIRELTKTPLGDNKSEYTPRSYLSVEEANKIAQKIFSMYTDLLGWP